MARRGGTGPARPDPAAGDVSGPAPDGREPVAAIVLAAGNATRMGGLKQLLPIGGQSLLRRAAWAASCSRCRYTRVVLGAEAVLLMDEVRDLGVEVLLNRNWRTGIASSIRAGLSGLPDEAEAALVVLADQVRVTPELLDLILDARRRDGAPLVACEYGGTLGAPAFFHRSLFPELLALTGDTGAKSVILRHRRDASRVLFEGGEDDLDDPEDYRAFLRGPSPPGPGGDRAPR